MSEGKNHSEQFKRYLKGKMTPEEANNFERANLDDPFTQEALEGFEGEGIERIEDIPKLSKKVTPRKETPWFRIASAAIFLIVGSFAIYSALDQMKSDEKLALNEEQSLDSALVKSQTDTSLITNDSEMMAAPSELEREEIAVSAEDLNQEQKIELLADQASEESFFIANDSFSEENEVEIGIMIQPSSRDIQLAQSNMMEKDIELLNVEEVPNETQISKKSTAGAAARSFSDISISEESIVEEIVFEENTDESTTQNLVSIEPVIGWVRYNQYLVDSLRYPVQAKSARIEGRVFVQVETTPAGAITKSIIVKGIGSGCDEEALRLISEGPIFKSDSIGGKGIIPVLFEIE